MKVAIIGAGLAGCSAAYVLKRAGAEPVIYDVENRLAAGASGNSLGLYNPRFSAHRNAYSDYFTAGFSLALQVFKGLDDIEWRPCGTLYLVTDEKKKKQFLQTVDNWQWEPEHMRLINAEEASEVAGIPLGYEALYLPEAGKVSPKKLCRAYVGGVEIRFGEMPQDLAALDATAVILACGYGVGDYVAGLPLSQVRGQITQVKSTKLSKSLQCNLCYGGYFSPSFSGVHMLGATFQRWLDHSDILEEDDEENLEKLSVAVPDLALGLEIIGHRASVRTTTKDYFPIVGAAPGHDGVYISTGHGSHGLISSLVAAHLLADMILDRPKSLSIETIQALSPARFY